MVPRRIRLTRKHPAGGIDRDVARIVKLQLGAYLPGLAGVGGHENNVHIVAPCRLEFQLHLQSIFQLLFACLALVNFQCALKRSAVVILRLQVAHCSHDFPVFL